MLRASSYNVYVDLPDDREALLLVHGYSGAYDKVAHHVATYVRSLEVGKPPRPLYGVWTPAPPVDGQVVPPSDATIDVLTRRGYLTELSVEEEVTFFTRVANRLHAQQNTPSYIFMPTYDCNLRCGYCFQDHMRTDQRYSHLLRLMKPDMIDRIFAAMPQIEAYHSLEPGPKWRKSMGFFGGEPLLAQSRKTVEYIINKAQAAGDTTFWAITNGTELDAYRDLLNSQQIQRIQITLDGPPTEHDQRRIAADGSGSFARIARNTTMALEQGVTVHVRMNIDRNNINHLPLLAEEIVRQGWDTYANFAAYTAPIVPGNDHTDIRTTMTTWQLDQAIDRLKLQHEVMRVIARPDERIVGQAQSLFGQHDHAQMHATFCGAHNGMYLFDAFGDIYACWERTGDKNIRIGTIDATQGFLIADASNQQWRSRNVTTNPICRKCRYSLYCGGGCAILAESQRGEFFTNHCDGFGARFRASVAEAYANHRDGLAAVLNRQSACDL